MKLEKLILVLVIGLALFLRLYNLDQVPPSLNWDEISHGYNAYSILKTGKDEWGFSFPLNFRAYGDYKLPAYIYLDVPFIALFGLNDWGVRLPSALAGVGTVLLIFLITKKLSKRWGVSLLATFLASVTPWLFVLSRIAAEANLALFLLTLAYYLFLKGLEKPKYFIPSSLFLGMSFFTYNSARVVVPLLLLSLIVLYYKKIKLSKSLIISLVLLGVFFAVAYPLAFYQDSSARYKFTKIIDQGAVDYLNENRGNSKYPELITKLIYNRISYFSEVALGGYLAHFSPNFLFLEGGSNYQYSIQGFGVLYPITLIFLVLGLIQLISKKEKWGYFLLLWILIGPIPSSITRDAPHPLRSIFMIVPLIITMGFGLEFLDRFKNSYLKKIIFGILILTVMVNLIIFWKNYTGDYIKKYSWSWQYGYKEAVLYADENYSQYDGIYFSKRYGEPHEFVLFYTKYDPQKYLNNPSLDRYQRSDWFWTDGFDKYHFLNDWEVGEKVENVHNSLLITSPGNYPSGGELIKKINFLDGTEAFDIVRLP